MPAPKCNNLHALKYFRPGKTGLGFASRPDHGLMVLNLFFFSARVRCQRHLRSKKLLLEAGEEGVATEFGGKFIETSRKIPDFTSRADSAGSGVMGGSACKPCVWMELFAVTSRTCVNMRHPTGSGRKLKQNEENRRSCR